MQWAEAYDRNQPPSPVDISRFVDSSLWDTLLAYVESTCTVSPRIEYSACTMQKGWNVKYRKRGRSLCVLYPMEGYFIALVVVGERARLSVFSVPPWGEVVRGLLEQTPDMQGSQWLMIPVRDAQTLEDVKTLIAIRAAS
ncbi:MAG: DUF3788 domain-containing protein [Anaerolineae bacterium]